MKDNELKIKQTQLVQSPCIGNCCLNNNDICLGCYRTIDEITGWREFTNDQRSKVNERCLQRKLDNQS